MNKTDLIIAVKNETNMSKTDAAQAVEVVLDSISKALAAGDSVNIAGFGAFTVKHVGARPGMNPRTGEAVEIAAHNKISFKAGKNLREAVQ